jgi:hypothetical protein
MSALRFTAILCIAAPQVANADWQYTRWGMTAPQIIAASKGEARLYQQTDADDFKCNNGLKAIAVIPKKTIAGRGFSVTFCSESSGQLSSVRLDNVGANVIQLRQTMISEYGQPIRLGPVGLMWNDKRTGNTISLFEITATGSIIEYKRSGGSGL